MFLRAFSDFRISDFFEMEFEIADNLVQAVEDGSIWQFILEMSYNTLVSQIIFAVILAVIIDGMQTLRMGKIAAMSDLNNRCFVCDLTSLRLEQAGENFMSSVALLRHSGNLKMLILTSSFPLALSLRGYLSQSLAHSLSISLSLLFTHAGITFGHHTRIVHDPHSYLYFLVYLRERRDSANCLAVERYVIDLIWCTSSEIYMRTQWLPRERTWMIEGKKEDSMYQSIESQVQELQAQIKTFQESQDKRGDRDLEAILGAIKNIHEGKMEEEKGRG